ncbi:MAG: recombination protein NinB [Pseudomonadota bacterium]
MTKRTLILANREVRQRAKEAIDAAPDGHIVEIREPKRNLEQNALLWSLLTAFSEQLEWPVNGKMCKLEPDEWKDLLSAAFKNETQRVAMGINGGMVILGMRTSKMSKRQFSEFLEFIHSIAADRGVTF